MNALILKSNSNMAISSTPMVLLPLDMYKRLTGKSKSADYGSFTTVVKRVRTSKRNVTVAPASESSLSKDWFKSVEEKVWQNL